MGTAINPWILQQHIYLLNSLLAQRISFTLIFLLGDLVTPALLNLLKHNIAVLTAFDQLEISEVLSTRSVM